MSGRDGKKQRGPEIEIDKRQEGQEPDAERV
jgi:hypothetical protein